MVWDGGKWLEVYLGCSYNDFITIYLPLFTITTELFECKHKTVAINIEEMHIICNMQIEETYIM